MRLTSGDEHLMRLYRLGLWLHVHAAFPNLVSRLAEGNMHLRRRRGYMHENLRICPCRMFGDAGMSTGQRGMSTCGEEGGMHGEPEVVH